MHSLMLRKNFIAQHFLIGRDFGAENLVHSHNYNFEVEIENILLNKDNFLVDIIEIKDQINELISNFQDKVLNELPEFVNQNPSLELFSKILWHKFKENSVVPCDSIVTVRLWEDDIAQASYREIK